MSCNSLGVFQHLRETALWGIGATRPVNDAECAVFVEQFYSRLSANNNVSDAFRYANSRLPATAKGRFHILKLEPPALLRKRLRFLSYAFVVVIAFVATVIIASLVSYFVQEKRIAQSEERALQLQKSIDMLGELTKEKDAAIAKAMAALQTAQMQMEMTIHDVRSRMEPPKDRPTPQ